MQANGFERALRWLRRRRVYLGLFILTALGLGGYVIYASGAIYCSPESWAKVDIRSLETMLKEYHGTTGTYPTTSQGLAALFVYPQSNSQSRYWREIRESNPRDPWGGDYVYISPGVRKPEAYDLYSIGPDRQPNTQDDIWR